MLPSRMPHPREKEPKCLLMDEWDALTALRQETPLILAAQAGHEGVCQLLLDAGTEVDAVDKVRVVVESCWACLVVPLSLCCSCAVPP